MKLDELQELGFSDGQIKVYNAILELGISTLNGIHEKTGIERRNIYDILNKLIEKGFVSYTEEKGKRTYQITTPNKLLDEVKKRQEQLKKIEEKIPDLNKIYESTKPDKSAEVYRGNESMKALLDDMLNYKESFWIGGNSGAENNTNLNFKTWFGHWMKKRVEKKHMMFDLVDYGTYLTGLKSDDGSIFKNNYYKKCHLPKNLGSPMVIAIYGNKVAQILWSQQSFAFVIESKEIRESFMKYFNYFWKEEKG